MARIIGNDDQWYPNYFMTLLLIVLTFWAATAIGVARLCPVLPIVILSVGAVGMFCLLFWIDARWQLIARVVVWTIITVVLSSLLIGSVIWTVVCIGK